MSRSIAAIGTARLDKFALVSFALSVTSVIAGLVVVTFWSGAIAVGLHWIPWPAAVLCGHIGRHRTRQPGLRGRSLATAGLALAYSLLAIYVATGVWLAMTVEL